MSPDGTKVDGDGGCRLGGGNENGGKGLTKMAGRKSSGLAAGRRPVVTATARRRVG